MKDIIQKEDKLLRSSFYQAAVNMITSGLPLVQSLENLSNQINTRIAEVS